MLTLFAIPKAFRGHINTIQRNAIKSWTLLNPKPEIILLGDDEGTAEVAQEFGLIHIPEVDRNEYGTPWSIRYLKPLNKLERVPYLPTSTRTLS